MRRWSTMLTGALVLSAAAACTGTPPGVDGDLTDDWRPPPAAAGFRPAAGVCHDDLNPSGALRDYAPIPCTETHVAETGAVGDRPPGGAESVFQRCGTLVDAFLGADWRTGWLVLQPVQPSTEARKGGADWVRCDLAQISPVDGHVVNRRASLKGGLRSGSSLLMACADPRIEGEQVTEMHPVACSKAHTSEFAGLFPTTARSSDDLGTTRIEKGCDTAIAKFAGVPDDGSITARVGWLGFPPDDASWQAGDHAIRCFLWLNGDKMIGSYRHAGPSKLRVHYVS